MSGAEVVRKPIASQERRRAVVVLSGEAVAALVGLPEGLQVVWCQPDDRRGGVTVVVEGDELDPVGPGMELPMLGGLALYQESVEVDGKLFWRLDWSRS